MTGHCIRRMGLVAAWLGLLSALAFADDGGFVKRLTDKFPATLCAKVAPSFPGFWSIVKGGEILFVRDDLSVLIRGDVIDLKSNRSLVASLREENPPHIDPKLLDPKDAILLGHGSRRLYVFSDPDCTFCRQLEPELMKVKDVQILIFPYPIVSLHPGAQTVAESIWCQKDRAAAWSAYLLERRAPAKATCDNPIARNLALGEQLQVTGTPSLVFSDGTVIPGSIGAERIEAKLALAARK